MKNITKRNYKNKSAQPIIEVDPSMNKGEYITVAMQYGREFWHWAHSRLVSSIAVEQKGQGDLFSSSSLFCGLRTMASIFFLYLSSIWPRVSGRISIAAKLNEEFLSPARWHSITVEVKMGTMSEIMPPYGYCWVHLHLRWQDHLQLAKKFNDFIKYFSYNHYH